MTRTTGHGRDRARWIFRGLSLPAWATTSAYTPRMSDSPWWFFFVWFLIVEIPVTVWFTMSIMITVHWMRRAQRFGRRSANRALAAVRPPREILSIPPPGGVFAKSDYPWLKALRITLHGGDGAPASDGTPGRACEAKSMMVSASDLPESITFWLGDGEGAHAMLELYGR